ncbi:MAG: RdgB/HAM1 family non-canonical purine NTP pyrophosphatase [Candidatus Saganbacteria bacterium]|nr:RdgB/HAM1 family non-canonical purine NTP pyrophosphatase [Candidatus Saganbacteria bacterium]
MKKHNRVKAIIVATSNKHKLKEIQDILKVPISSFNFPVTENGKTFEANAIKKAKAACQKTGQTAIADDSGLEVKCLDGKPGVRSARFAGPNPTPEKLCNKLLKTIRNTKYGIRKAQFVCVIAIAYPNGKTKTVKGICRGKIIHEMRGNKGFSYDPVFVPSGYKKTFAEMSPITKNRLSHRGRALRKLKRSF